MTGPQSVVVCALNFGYTSFTNYPNPMKAVN